MNAIAPKLLSVQRYQGVDVLQDYDDRFVAKAYDAILRQQVFLKGRRITGPEVVAEVRAEFQQLWRLRHPMLPRALTFEASQGLGEIEGPCVFFSQEWIAGADLLSVRGKLSVDSFMGWFESALALLDWLARAKLQWLDYGLSRLDLKAAHFLKAGERWKLIDLGEVRQDNPFEMAERHGTLGYMAPELVDGKPSGPVSDLYSLGIVAYEVLTGELPSVLGGSRDRIYEGLMKERPVSLPDSDSGLDPLIAQVVRRLTEPNPTKRYGSAREVRELLEFPIKAAEESMLHSTVLPSRWARQLGELPGLLADVQTVGGGGVLIQADGAGDLRYGLDAASFQFMAQTCPTFAVPGALCSATGSEACVRELLASIISFLQLYEPSIEASAHGSRGLDELAEPSASCRDSLKTLLSLSQARHSATGAVCAVIVELPDGQSSAAWELVKSLAPLLAGSGLLLVVGLPALEMPPVPLDSLPAIRLTNLTRKEVHEYARMMVGDDYLAAEHVVIGLLACSQGRLDLLRGVLQWRLEHPERPLAEWEPSWNEAGDESKDVSALSVPEDDVFSIAAVLPQPFAQHLLAEVLTEAGIAVPSEDPAETLQASDVLERLPDWEPLHWRFRSEQLRRHCEARLPAAERAGICRIVGKKLEELVELPSSPGFAMLATTFLNSTSPMRAVPYLSQAVDEALSQHRPDRALSLLERSLELIPLESPRRSELLRRKGKILAEMGSSKQAAAAFSSAVEAAGVDSAQRARCKAALARVLMLAGEFADALELLRDCTTLKPTARMPRQELALWWQWLAWLYMQESNSDGVKETLDLELARAALQHAAAQGLSAQSPEGMDQGYLEVRWEQLAGKPPAEVAKKAETFLALAEANGYDRGRDRLLNLLLNLYLQQGDLDAVKLTGERLNRLGRESVDLSVESRAVYNVGIALRTMGRPQEALLHFERAMKLDRLRGDIERELANQHELVDILLDAAQILRAEIELNSASRRIEQLPKASEVILLTQELLSARLKLRKLHKGGLPLESSVATELEATLERLDTQFSKLQPSWLTLEAKADRMELALQMKRPFDALRLWAPLLERRPKDHEGQAWERLHRLAIDAHQRLLPTWSLGTKSPDSAATPVLTTLPPAMNHVPEQVRVLAVSGPTLPPAPPVLTDSVPSSVSGTGAVAVPADVVGIASQPTQVEPPNAPVRELVQPVKAAQSGQVPAFSDPLIPPQVQKASSPAHKTGDDGNPSAETGPGGAWKEWTRAGKPAPTLSAAQVLTAITELLSAGGDDHALSSKLAELVGRLLGGKGLVILLENGVIEEGQISRLKNPYSRTLVMHVAKSKKLYRCSNSGEDDFLKSISSAHRKQPSIICAPIMGSHENLLGVVYVDELETGKSDDPSVIQAVQELATVTARYLESIAQRKMDTDIQVGDELALGSSKAMRKVIHQVNTITKAKSSDLVVLLLGETGVGKNHISRLIHKRVAGPKQELVPVNCSAIPSELMEANLFGAVKGSFTGCVNDMPGFFSNESTNTVFLDEIGELPLPAQAKLLTVLDEGELRRVGDGKTGKFKGRVLCATNRDLEAMCERGEFRRDLLERLSVNVVKIPPLRERGEQDIRRIATQMLRRELTTIGSRDAKSAQFEDRFVTEAQTIFIRHPWRGNVREISNFFRNELIRSALRDTAKNGKIMPALVSEVLERLGRAGVDASSSVEPVAGTIFPPGLKFWELKAAAERQISAYIQEVVEGNGGSKDAAAKALECNRSSIYGYLGELEGTAGKKTSKKKPPHSQLVTP